MASRITSRSLEWRGSNRLNSPNNQVFGSHCTLELYCRFWTRLRLRLAAMNSDVLYPWLGRLFRAKPLPAKAPAAPSFDKHSVAFKDWKPSVIPTPRLDELTDEQLQELDHLLDFNCFTTDSKGRRFGLPAGPKKRGSPQELPDRRVVELNRQVPLDGLHVLEVGCFEGVHTISLCLQGAQVTAIDSRVENVVKTMVRSGFYGVHPDVRVCDLETLGDTPPDWMATDVLFHVGVLYHLTDPVGHLKTILKGVRKTIVLDTHVARPEQCNGEYTTAGRTWRYFRFREQNQHVFAGMLDHAKWLLPEDLNQLLTDAGFVTIQPIEERNENNGKRIYWIAHRLKD